MTVSEKRNHRRFDLSLPVQVRLRTQTPQWQEAATNDISARGIYFNAQGDFEEGSPIQWEVTLPPELCQGKAIRVKCRGRIIRVERGNLDGSIGVAAAIDTYEFASTS